MKILYKFIDIGQTNDPSNKQKDRITDFISLLEDDVYFEKRVNKVRTDTGIKIDNVKSLKLWKENGPEAVLKEQLRQAVLKEGIIASESALRLLKDFSKEYDVNSIFWNPPLLSFIYTGIMLFLPGIVYKDGPITFSEDEVKISPLGITTLGNVCIRINYLITKTQFKKFIDKNWKDIKCILLTNNKNGKLTPNINIPNLEVYKFIGSMRSMIPKCSYSKIADLLTDKYGKAFSDDEVRAMYNSNYKKIIRNLRRNTVKLK